MRSSSRALLTRFVFIVGIIRNELTVIGWSEVHSTQSQSIQFTVWHTHSMHMPINKTVAYCSLATPCLPLSTISLSTLRFMGKELHVELWESDGSTVGTQGTWYSRQ